MPKPDAIQSALQDGLELTLDGWRKFNARDSEATEAAVEIMEAAAALAEKYPEEYFRMKPSARDLFYRELRRDLARAAGAGGERIPTGDITGGDDFIESFGKTLLGEEKYNRLRDLLGGGDEGGTQERPEPEEPKEDGFDFLVAEKEFWLGMLDQGLNEKTVGT